MPNHQCIGKLHAGCYCINFLFMGWTFSYFLSECLTGGFSTFLNWLFPRRNRKPKWAPMETALAWCWFYVFSYINTDTINLKPCPMVICSSYHFMSLNIYLVKGDVCILAVNAFSSYPLLFRLISIWYLSYPITAQLSTSQFERQTCLDKSSGVTA